MTALAQAMTFNSSLVQLDAFLNPMVGDGACPSLATMIAMNESLRELNLYEVGMTTDGALLLLQAAASNPTLQRIDLSSNDIDKELAGTLVDALNQMGKKISVTL